jgi:hypothetical protein
MKGLNAIFKRKTDDQQHSNKNARIYKRMQKHSIKYIRIYKSIT